MARGAFSTNSLSKNQVGARLRNPATSTNRIMSPKVTIPGEICATSAGMNSSLTSTAAMPPPTEKAS